MSGYPQYLKYFMWSWQVHFRISCQTRAESIFNQLDRNLTPNIFFIGFLDEDIHNSPPVCIEPEKIPVLIEAFANISDVAKEILENDRGRSMLYSGDGMQEEMDKRLERKSVRLAIERMLNEQQERNDKIYFSTNLQKINNYSVYVILELKKSVYNFHIHLKKEDSEERFKTSFSFIESLVNVFLKDIEFSISLPSPGKNLSSDFRESNELLREAAKDFMYTIAWVGKNVEGIHLLFDSCNKISTTKYEGDENNGHLIIAVENNPDIKVTLQFEEPFQIYEHRKVRKMLQLTNSAIGLLSNSKDVYGLGFVKSTYNSSKEAIFDIFFKGIHCYDILHCKTFLMEMRYGLPQIHSSLINEAEFKFDFKRIFTKIKRTQLDTLYKLAIAATKQKKGATIVFLADAASEARRLQKQCITIQKTKLNEKLIVNLTTIDGGILVDLDGYVYAKGVILDGIVGLNGDSARGSRYNSAVTYQEYRGLKKPTIILVVSEDGMVDVIPSLEPPIKHSEILQTISFLEELNSTEKFDSKAFNNSMKWLENREFYLTDEECNRINILKTQLQELDKKMGEKTLWILHRDLHPNPRMNSFYYINEMTD